jgi:hypothetical protein
MTAAVALMIGGLALPGNASAQAINVFKFECGSTPGTVNVDVRGLGNTDVCVSGTATVDLSCACVGGGGNCPTDAKKQTIPTTVASDTTLQPQNGRVNKTDLSVLSLSFSDADCTAPQCGSGQTTKLIEWTTEDDEPTFTLTEGACGSGGRTLAGPISCGSVGATTFAGKHGSCAALF